MSLLSRLANVFRSDRLGREIDDELAAHLEEAASHGRDSVESRRALGSPLRYREASRDIKLIPWLDSLRADIVFGWRQLKKRKATSLAAILSLGLAIGACTAAFRIIDALFLRPLPISNPQRLYAFSLRGIDMDGNPQLSSGCSYPQLRRMRAAAGDSADLLAISFPNRAGVTYGSDQEPERPYRQYVSGRMFAVFGLRPALGRLLTEDDDLHPRASPVAVLSFEYWTRRFGRDPKVLGRAFHIGDDLFTIIGVAPEGFTGVEPGAINDIFVPAMMSPFTEQPGTNWFHTMVMLKAGEAPEPVRQKLQAAVRAFFEEQIRDFHGVGMPQQVKDAIINQQVLLDPAPAGVSGMQHDYRQALIAIGVLVALVMLIACANVANLMTAQAAARAREMALRISIGAGRARLIQLVLVEAALIALFAAAAGAAFAWWASPFVVARINPRDNPARMVLPADWRVLGFALTLTVAIAFLLALAPALRAARADSFDALRGGGSRRGARLMYALIAAQVSFCFLVLFVAGLFVATLQRLTHQDLGFDPERLLVLDIGARQDQPQAVWDQVAERLRTVPGVGAVASSGWPLLSGGGWENFISVNGGPPSKTVVNFLEISPRWMETMRIPFVAGRDFRAGDEFGHVAIVNQIFAEKFFKGENPLGKSFSAGQSAEIVGVVRNAYYSSLRESLGPVAYGPSTLSESSRAFLVRTAAANSLALAPTLRKEISQIQPGLSVNNIGTQQELIDNQTVRERLLAMLGLFFAAVALLLAAVGLYGVLDYSVFQRRREIGIRMAIGAQAGDIARRVAFEMAMWVIAGAAAGLALGLSSVRFIESLLYSVTATDAGALAAPALALLATAILAALPPVIRAVRVDPVEVLRSE